jgi:hypothetical protein
VSWSSEASKHKSEYYDERPDSANADADASCAWWRMRGEWDISQ